MDKAMIKKMARETGLSIEEAEKALRGLVGKGLVEPNKSKKFPFLINMERVAEIARGIKK